MPLSVPQVSCFLLVDPQGRVLLQERDEGAPTHPNQWCTPGGHLEPGETYADAAYREAWEETGVVFRDGELVPWLEERHVCAQCGPVDHAFFVGDVDLVDADITCTEGRQLVFRSPEQAAALDLTPPSRHYLTLFFASAVYGSLLTPAHRLGGPLIGRSEDHHLDSTGGRRSGRVSDVEDSLHGLPGVDHGPA